MRQIISYMLLGVVALVALACDHEVRNIGKPSTATDTPTTDPTSGVTPVNPVNINNGGFDLLEKMQGHWVGINRVIATDYPWFSFDYRAISPSHVHGIFEGGSMGNLLTSFFVTDFKNTRTIMARNGGLLNGIYRTSYFVLDSIGTSSTQGSFYRLVDAVGGRGIMSMELRFKNDSLYFNAYTSRLGLAALAKRHMTFKAVRRNASLAQAAATATNFPQNTAAWDFSNGFVQENLYVNQGKTAAESASFLFQDAQADVFTLAPLSGDPFTISNHPRLSNLEVKFSKTSLIQGKDLFVYLSYAPLTDANGILKASGDAFDTVLKFPVVDASQTSFMFTYLHPGNYYLTVVADQNGDGTISSGDVVSPSQVVTINAASTQQLTVDDILVQN
jgi:hypothetical protein